MRYALPKKSAVFIVAIILTVNFLTYSVASSLIHSIILPSAGVIVYSSSSTIVVQVGASHDDAGPWWDWAGYYWPWTLDKSHVSVGHFQWEDKYYNGGLRFTDANIPQGAKIVSAVLKACSDQTCAGTGARWNVYGENAGNSNEFSTKEEFEARPKTIASIDTGFLTIWVEGEWYTIADVASVIQEIVNRSDWSSGNALALLLCGHTEARTTHEIRSYDADPSQAAVLEVTYETIG